MLGLSDMVTAEAERGARTRGVRLAQCLGVSQLFLNYHIRGINRMNNLKIFGTGMHDTFFLPEAYFTHYIWFELVLK